MFSAESLTSPHPGFPELFQTGETYHGEPLVDHQHPHNVFAELAALYTLPLTEKISWELYGGPSAEPALGPVTYIHRASAAELPLAPLSHHLQDSTHTSFGVVTTGFVIDRVKLEASAFNGREPNEERWSIQLAALDSWSGRASVAPASNWTAQYSVGRLEHPEALEPGSQWRETASVEYNRPATGSLGQLGDDCDLGAGAQDRDRYYTEQLSAGVDAEFPASGTMRSRGWSWWIRMSCFRRRRCIRFTASGRTRLAGSGI